MIFAVFLGGARPAAAQGAYSGDQTVIGGEEPLLVSYEGGESLEVLTNVDTGAGYAAIDETVARDDLGIDVDDPPTTVTIRSAIGNEERPLVPVQVQLAGQTLNIQATVSDRSDLSTKMNLGSRDLDGFLVDVSERQLTQPDSPMVESYVASLLEFPPPPPNPAMLLAALPLAALLVVALRSLVGLRTFGTFAPVLLSVAFVQSGLPAGLLVFSVMMLAGLLIEPLLRPLRLPRVARLGVLLAVVAAVLIGLSSVISDPGVATTWTSAFPVVIISIFIERFWELWEQEGFKAASKVAAVSLLVAVLATPLLVSSPVRWVTQYAPVAFAIAGAVLSIVIGRYKGLRLTELIRFRPAAEGKS
jgi:7 transmembrane helices usually fused to an inactive transglutaminase/Putative ATP-dependant zinc protease